MRSAERLACPGLRACGSVGTYVLLSLPQPHRLADEVNADGGWLRLGSLRVRASGQASGMR